MVILMLGGKEPDDDREKHHEKEEEKHPPARVSRVMQALDMNEEHVADCYLAIQVQPRDCKDFVL